LCVFRKKKQLHFLPVDVHIKIKWYEQKKLKMKVQPGMK
jgi:hypothetical protein